MKKEKSSITKYLVIILISFLVQCKYQTNDMDLSGNWYGSFEKKQDTQAIEYFEVFITNDTVYNYSEIHLTSSPGIIEIRSDSVFMNTLYHVRENQWFIGHIFNITEHRFDIGINDSIKISYYRLKDTLMLSDLIKGQTTEELFKKEFFKRAHNRYKTLNID